MKHVMLIAAGFCISGTGTYDEEKDRVVFNTWERIAVDMNFTYKWVSGGLHQRALAQVQKALDERKGE